MDQGNLFKSETKHGIEKEEGESVFSDLDRTTYYNVKHSIDEDRYICIGKSNQTRILFCYFTLRNGKIRIIGARIANKRERNEYEILQKIRSCLLSR